MITNTINKQLQTALLLSAMGLGLLGCQDVDLLEDFAPMPTQAADTTLTAPSHHIPRNAALASLEAFLQNDAHGAKSRRRIGRVSGITPVQPGAKASSPLAVLGCDTLLYLVGFEHEQGYALLAADDRIGSDILAVTDNGSLSERDVHCAIEALKPSAGIQPDPDYPTTGPGIVYDDDGNAYMNPNTFDPYDPEADDYLIGNIDNSEEVNAAGGFVKAREHDGVQALMTTMVVRYAVAEIMGKNLPRQDLQIDPDWGGGGGGSSSYIEIRRSDEAPTYGASVAPMFAADGTSYWHQGSPFNDNCPMVRKWVIVGPKQRANCGCVPLAVARVMAHFERCPLPVPGLDWYSLKHNLNSAAGKRSAARLLHTLGLSMGALYFYQGTFALPSAAALVMSLGFSSVSYSSYNTDNVMNALNRGCPIIVSSLPKNKKGRIDLPEAHAWNIDGYRIKYTKWNRHYYENGKETHSEYAYTTTTTMMHCNFGWGGLGNGYFASGIFNSDSSDKEWDGSSTTFNYNFYLNTITYANPNK